MNSQSKALTKFYEMKIKDQTQQAISYSIICLWRNWTIRLCYQNKNGEENMWKKKEENKFFF